MANFYVSTTGSDSNSGTSVNAAFKTLARAQEAMRASAGNDTAFVREGTYKFAAPLTLTEQDNGSSFKAYGTETPHLQGGSAISAWTKGANGVWTAKLNYSDVHQLTLNGEKLTEARFPNETPSDPIKGGWKWGEAAVAGLDPKKHLAFDPADFAPGQLQVGMKITLVIDANWGSNVLEI